MTVYLLPLSDLPFSECELLLPFVSPERRERIGRMKNDGMKRLSLYAGLLARMAVSVYSGVPAAELSFAVTGKGKPYCLSAGCRFSLSHTPGMVVCAVSSSDVGADAERIRPMPERVVSRFAAGERDFILGSADRGKRFFRVWTRKEAYGKYLGVGLAGGVLRENTLSPDFSRICHTFRYGVHICSVYGEDNKSIMFAEINEETVNEFYTD